MFVFALYVCKNKVFSVFFLSVFILDVKDWLLEIESDCI